MSGLLGREAILQADDLPTMDVKVPEWGGTVRLRMLSGTERDQFEETVHGKGKTNMKNFRARFCSLVMIDEQGGRLFGDDEVAALGRKSSAALSRVFNAGMKFNGLTKKDAEELAGN